MKKKLILLCVLALLVMGLAVSAHADGTTVAVTPSVDTVGTGKDCEADESREVTLTIGAEGFDRTLSGGQFTIQYDSARFEYIQGSFKIDPRVAGNGDTLGVMSDNSGVLLVMGNLINGVAPDNSGDLFTVQFRAKQTATTASCTFTIPDVGLTLYSTGGNINGTDATINSATVQVDHTHNITSETINNNPTCTTTGDRDITCTYCGDQKNEEIPALGHDFSDGGNGDGQDATCTEDGKYETYTCKRSENGCGGKDYILVEEEYVEVSGGNEVIAHEGHQFGEKVDEKKVTCADDGWDEHYECTVCEEWFATDDAESKTPLEDAYHEALNHKNATHVDAKKPVYGETPEQDQPGYYEHWYCPDCGTYFYANPEDGSIDTTQHYGEGGEFEDMPDDLQYTRVAGDANEDGYVDGNDTYIILRYLGNKAIEDLNDQLGLGMPLPYDTDCSPNMRNSDVDGTNEVNGNDTYIILRYLANKAIEDLNAQLGLQMPIPYDTDCTLQ